MVLAVLHQPGQKLGAVSRRVEQLEPILVHALGVLKAVRVLQRRCSIGKSLQFAVRGAKALGGLASVMVGWRSANMANSAWHLT